MKLRLILFHSLIALLLSACKNPDAPTPYEPWEALYWLDASTSTPQGLFLSDDTLLLRQSHPDTLMAKGMAFIRRNENQYISLTGTSISVGREADSLTYIVNNGPANTYAVGRKVTAKPSFSDLNNELRLALPDTIWFGNEATFQNQSVGNFIRFIWVFPYQPISGSVQTFSTTGLAPLSLTLFDYNFQPNPTQDSSAFTIQLRAYRPDGSRVDHSFPAKAFRR